MEIIMRVTFRFGNVTNCRRAVQNFTEYELKLMFLGENLMSNSDMRMLESRLESV